MKLSSARTISLLAAVVFLSACPTDDPERPDRADMGMDVGGVDMEEDGGETDELSLTKLEPAMGSVTGGTTVKLSGSGFQTPMTVTFGSAAGTDVVVMDDSNATVVTPSGEMPGAVTVTVENPDGAKDSILNGFTFVESQDPIVDFCRLQAQSPVSGTAGQPTDVIYAVVFSDGITQGDGQGDFIEGQLGYGTGTGYESFDFVDMAYNTDKDGLNQGDLANDEYGAPLTIQVADEYRYVARFRTEQRPNEWVYCDLDGSDNGIAADQLGTVEITEPEQPEISFCQLQPQSPVTVQTGNPTDVIGALVFADGITQGDGQGSGIVAELGYGDGDHQNFTWKPATYMSDVDGLNQGDKANDEYGRSFTIPVAGTYGYAARFRLSTEPDGWVYCDLNGNSDGISSDQYGTIEVEDPPTPEITYCETETASVTATTGQATTEITGLVFAGGVTAGAGEGPGVTAEIVWGDAGTDPTTWTDSVAADYAEDVDGLSPGDLANDRYSATLTAGTAGDYEYAYRFSLDGGTSWSYCDTDGSDGTTNGFEATKVGTLDVNDQMIELPDACNLQFPQIDTGLAVGESLTVYGRVTEAGVTGAGMVNANLKAQLLVGPIGTDPETDPGAFTQIDGSINTNTIGLGPDEDEYATTYTPMQAGEEAFLYRFSVDGGQNWAYCDLDGNDSASGFDTARIGYVETSAMTPDLVDYCRVWQTTLSATTADSSPPITVEIYEDPLTVNNGGSNSDQLDVEVGYGPDGVNPALDGAYTWNATLLPFKGVGPSRPNNYEYEGAIYPDSDKPTAGMYDVAVRVRKSGSTVWTYCDADETTMDFQVDQTTDFEVTP